MSLSDKSLKNKLSKYSKADIIDAVCNEFTADHIVHGMLIFLESRTTNRLIDEECKAFRAQDAAGDAYVAWHDDMIKRFGNGESVNFSNIPAAELKKGARLGDAWKAAMKRAQEATNRLNRNLGIPIKKEAAHENA